MLYDIKYESLCLRSTENFMNDETEFLNLLVANKIVRLRNISNYHFPQLQLQLKFF